MENDTQTQPGTDKTRDGLSYLTMAQSQLLWPQPAVRQCANKKVQRVADVVN